MKERIKAPINENRTDSFMEVAIYAKDCRQDGNKVYVTIPYRQLSVAQSETLEELFHHTFNRMENLLAIEALLVAIVGNDH